MTEFEEDKDCLVYGPGILIELENYLKEVISLRAANRNADFRAFLQWSRPRRKEGDKTNFSKEMVEERRFLK